MDAPSNFLSRVGLAISMYASSKASDGDGGGAGGPVAEEEQSFSSIRNSELYPHNGKVVDKGCPATVQPFPLLSGEALEYIGLLAEDSYIAISNYRFFVSRQNGFFNVPTGLIDSVDLYGSKEQTVVLCKDGGSFCVSFGSQSHCTMWLDRLRRAICGARDLDKTFAFVHWAYSRDQATTPTRNQATPPALNGGKPLLNSEYGQVYSSDVVRAEFRRMQMDVGGSWRISDCNCEYKLCPTYPKLLVVPSSLTEEEIRSAAKFRALGRFPTVVWRHTGNGSVIARSSQPLVGVLGWRNPEDEKLLHAISLSCSTPVTGHTPSNGSSSPVPIPYRNGGPLAQMMDDRGQMVQSVFMNNGHTSEPPAFETSHSQFVLQDVIQTCPELHDGRTACPELHDGRTACPELQDGHAACPELLVIDLRSYAAALGNRAKGGGCECTDYYPNCEVVYKNLPNIHSVRKSFQQLRSALHSDDQSNFLSNLEGTQWLHYLCQLISVACDVVQTVHDKARPVLVHCSDGWDRTAQVVPLAELMLDPYYRTIEGFQVLVEREWLGFGHRFSDRCGQHAACPDVNQRSPVFLQWLDCVHQLLLQFPSHFQFNHNLLVKLGLHSYSCLYGTLLGNSMKERDGARVGKRTLSLWSLINPRNPEVVNHLFTTAGPQVLRPEASIQKMELWRAMFQAPCLTPSSALSSSSAHTPITTTTTSVSSSAPSTSTQVEGRTSDVPNEVEMKEMAGVTTRSRGHSDSSFASVSSSSSPAPPLEGAERGAEIKTTPGGHEGTEETRSMEDKDAVTQPVHENLHEDMSLPPPCDVSHDSTIETDSAHNNHIAPPPLLSCSHTAELPLVSHPLPANAHTHLFTSVSSDLLHDAIHDHSPRQQHGESFLNGARHIVGHSSLPLATTHGAVDEEMWSGVRIDSDGITSRIREEDWRLLRVLQCYEARIAGLSRQLVEMKMALRECVREGERGRRGSRRRGEEHEEEEEEEETATTGTSVLEDNQSPVSLASWECVEDGEGVGVKWVPDHAATHCQGCAAAFSLIIRKHHCRACGGVFCHSCSDYQCPVPDQHLYTDVRVCSRCYNRLDGHLIPESSGEGPT